MDELKEDYREDASFFQTAIDAIVFPIRVATSPILLRTYLRTFLLILTSTILFAFAVVAYSSFYYTYIPVRGICVPVYLQFDHGTASSYLTDSPLDGAIKPGKWPYGLANIPGLVDRQKYDVVVEMQVPRSDINLKAGNWMVGLEFRGPSSMGQDVKQLLGWDEEWNTAEDYSLGGGLGETVAEKVVGTEGGSKTREIPPTVLARSRRPVLLTYRSWSLEHVHRLLRLPLYLSGWHTESEHVEVGMMESVIFRSGFRNIPSSLRLELRSRAPLEVYSASVRISARLEGIRWLMYRYWFSSAVVGILAFWGMEMGVLLFTWAAFTLLFGGSTTQPPKNEDERVKKEEEEGDGEEEPDTPFSNTSRTFPTLPSQQPLSYSSPTPKDEPQSPTNLEDIPTREEQEADDEDDDYVLEEPIRRGVEREGVFTDSGLGTSLESSLESSLERGLARRRSGRQSEGDGEREGKRDGPEDGRAY